MGFVCFPIWVWGSTWWLKELCYNPINNSTLFIVTLKLPVVMFILSYLHLELIV